LQFQLETKDECLLLLACLRASLGTGHEHDVADLMQRPLQWERVMELGAWHDVLPFLHRALAGHAEVPTGVREKLHRNFDQSVRYSLFLLGEQLRIHEKMTAQGLRVIAWKGPVLATRLYGSCAYRRSCDVDLLARPEDCCKALEVLFEMGYIIPNSRLSAQQLSYWQRAQHEARLVHPETFTVVELHDAILPEFFLLKRLNSSAVFDRAKIQDGPFPVFSLSLEDEFLALCGHGTKHCWDRLKWLCDIAQFFRRYADALDWKQELKHADRNECRNVVLLVAALASEVLGSPLPAPLQKALAGNSSIQYHASMLVQTILSSASGISDDVVRSRLHFAVMQNSKSRLAYLCRKVVWVNPDEMHTHAPTWSWRISYYPRRILRASAKGLAYFRPGVR